MQRKYFGTDGVRGKVGEHPITPEFVMRLGFAAGEVLTRASNMRSGSHPGVLIGKDTRISGYMLEAALEAGFSAAGIDVMLCGPLPTPGIAYLTRALRLQAGVVISASHNAYQDNGIKFFASDGGKLPDGIEADIESRLDLPMQCRPSAQLGKAKRISDAAGRYVEFCKSTFPSVSDLRGVRIVLDCAHGAAYHIAPHVFHELGAEVTTIGANPDGFNINQDVGATAPQALRATVLEQQADLGIALDGDGDRLVMVGKSGEIFDGDQLMYAIAVHRKANGGLKGVVGTLMSNLALELALRRMDVEFERAKVGDRYVLESLRKRGWELGGENSGHILCLDKHTTGDGIISALQVLVAARDSGKTLDELAGALRLFPQVLLNIPAPRAFDWSGHTQIVLAKSEVERQLGDEGRVLLRPSGTEPLMRVMVEGRDSRLVNDCARQLADVVKSAVGN